MSFMGDYTIFFLHMFFLTFCECGLLPACDKSKLDTCGGFEGIECNELTNTCECSAGYEFNPTNVDLSTACVKYSNNVTPPVVEGSSVTIVIFLFLTLVLLTTALVFINRRYNLFHWIRQKLFARRSSGVTYEDVMIGQDDPPISA